MPGTVTLKRPAYEIPRLSVADLDPEAVCGDPAPLARVELEEGLAAVTTRLPQMILTPRVLGHSGVRKVSTMTVGWL